MSRADQKIAEADDLIAQADKKAATGLFKWKPDWDGAVVLYEKAATLYKTSKAFEKAKMAFEKASNAQKQLDMLHKAAFSMEQAGQICKDQGQVDAAVKYYVRASNFHQENGVADKAAELLTKAARLMEEVDVDKSFELYKQACDLYDSDDKQALFSLDTYKLCLGLLVKNKRFDEALDVLKQLYAVLEKAGEKTDLYRAYLNTIIIHLARDDVVGADKAFNDFMATDGFIGCPESLIINELMDAFQNGNQDGLNACLKKQIFTFLDIQFQKLAKTLKVGAASAIGAKEDMESHLI